MATATATRARRTAQTTPPAVENDVRVAMFNAFMNCPHRDTEAAKKIHEDLRVKDPLFYAHLAAWYRKQRDQVRDHNELFSAMLVTDPYVENRETGLALFREHVTFMKDRIVGYVKGKVVKLREKTGKKIKVGKHSHDEVKITEKEVGLKKALPTCLRTEIENYLNWLEEDPTRFDTVALRNGRALKNLYFAKGKHAFKHSERVQKILFEKDYPKDSKLNVLKEVSEAKTPEKAAKLIVENKLPYHIAVGLVDKITPSILVALIDAMTPQEVINNMASLQDQGALDNPDTKALIEAKLEKAKKSGSVSALKAKTAVSTGRIKDDAVAKKLDDVSDVLIKKTGTIKVPTAVFVDRSGSMSEAIEVGKQVAAMISGVTTEALYVVAFDDSPMEIKSTGKTLSDWERAFKPVRPGGSTSMACALRYLHAKKMAVDQIVVVTDEGENCAPTFAQAYPEYCKAFNVTPHVVIIHVGAAQDTTFSCSLKMAGIAFDIYTPNAKDNYSLPGLVTLLSRRSKLDLIMEIMDTPLPVRKAFRL
jgi:hypothetical protein